MNYLPSPADVINWSANTMLSVSGERDDSDSTWVEDHSVSDCHQTTCEQILLDVFGFLSRIDEDDVKAYMDHCGSSGWSELISDYWIVRKGFGASFADRGVAVDGERLDGIAEMDSEYYLFDDHVDDLKGWFYE